MPNRLTLCFLLAFLVLLPWLALGQTAPIAVNIPAPIDGGGQVAVAAPGTVTLTLGSLIAAILAALLPGLAAHLSAFVSSNRPWMKILDLIAGNYLAARNDPARQ